MPTTTTVVVEDPERPMTRAEFCKAESISLSSYHKLQLAKRGPEETRFPGLSMVRISAEARRAWHEQNKRWSASDDAALEAQRKRGLARVAGQKSGESKREAKRQSKKLVKRAKG
jgi:hypothetical protein